MEIQAVRGRRNWHAPGWSLALGLCLVAWPVAAYEEAPVTDGGTVAGRVWFPGEYPESETFKVPKDNHVCGVRKPYLEFIVDEESRGLKNVIIEVRGVAAGKPFDLSAAALDQKECEYLPHVQVAPAASKVELTNSDPILHNIHAFAGDETLFNVAQPPVGHLKFKKDLAAETGAVKIVCDVHEWMSAYIYVADHPYVAMTDDQGHFSLADVPPGTYTVVAWHEGLGEMTKEVVVTPGAEATVDFEIGK